MANIEKVVNGWIIRGRTKGGNVPVTYVALSREGLFEILETKLEL